MTEPIHESDRVQEAATLRAALEMVKATIPQLVFASPSSRDVAELIYVEVNKALAETARSKERHDTAVRMRTSVHGA